MRLLGLTRSTIGRVARTIVPPSVARSLAARLYAAGSRTAWSAGYSAYKEQYVANVLSDDGAMATFRTRGRLPPGYGVGLDERCVEVPWLFANANKDAREYLDAGSALNHEYLLRSPFWSGRRLTIVTLAPEGRCFWSLGVNYHFADLRRLPFLDGWFDEVACLSTLEHIGMDNRVFDPSDPGRVDPSGLVPALRELRRVLRPTGRLLLTVPFGRYENHGLFQQFDAALLEQASRVFAPGSRTDTFYRYDQTGWQLAERAACADSAYSRYGASCWTPGARARPPEPDGAAAARAVACCIWQRS